MNGLNQKILASDNYVYFVDFILFALLSYWSWLFFWQSFLEGEIMWVPTKLPWWIDRLSMFIGAASNPFADPFQYRVHRLAKKVEAGVDFIQTQCIYDMKRFKEFMKQIVDMGLHEKCKILAGVTPL